MARTLRLPLARLHTVAADRRIACRACRDAPPAEMPRPPRCAAAPAERQRHEATLDRFGASPAQADHSRATALPVGSHAPSTCPRVRSADQADFGTSHSFTESHVAGRIDAKPCGKNACRRLDTLANRQASGRSSERKFFSRIPGQCQRPRMRSGVFVHWSDVH